MDSLDLIRTFREVAMQGSFSKAAKRLGLSKATASKYVAELETRFGVRLLNRSTRSVSLTDAGSLLLERSQPVMEMVELTQAELQERANQPRGRLRISAPVGMASGDLPNLLAEFMGYYPDVNISLQLTNQADLAEEGIDVGLRFGPIEDENLIVRRLLCMQMVVCASPVYWRKHGMPRRPEDLTGHTALTLVRQGIDPTWRFEERGRKIDVPVKSRMEASEAGPLIHVAMRGLGVIYVPALVVQPHLDHGELVPVLGEFSRKDMWLSAAYLQRRHNSAALRALLDFLESRIGPKSNYAKRQAQCQALQKEAEGKAADRADSPAAPVSSAAA
ncbi:LysR family transcriptional regulator [uncultured Pseudacidovorax sp.]|uniref:LysR family transcriptional regulator n=1 Tax=uncultured Pseudacidovorax sp. TaxID=679313 RepID=UPI0026000AB0|nr:LysR family transcriptional regulator [uncultured Pseudacidovorax sp.]